MDSNCSDTVLQYEIEGETYSLLEIPSEINKKEQGNSEELIWTDAAIYLLLEEYRKLKDAFRNPKSKKRDLWWQIKTTFENHSYHNLTPEILDKKFRNLKQTYHRIKDNQNTKRRTGRGAIRWKYFHLMEEIFHVDNNITVPAIPIESSARSSSLACSVARPPALSRNSTVPIGDVTDTAWHHDITVTNERASYSTSPQQVPASTQQVPTFAQQVPTSTHQVPTSVQQLTTNEKATVKRKMRKNLLTYRSELLKTEKDRVASIRELKRSIDENTAVMKTLVEIQRERNDLIQQLVNK